MIEENNMKDVDGIMRLWNKMILNSCYTIIPQSNLSLYDVDKEKIITEDGMLIIRLLHNKLNGI